MNYHDMSTEQLINRIQELERLNKQLLIEIDKSITLNLSWAQNLGHWYLDFTNGTVTFNDRKINALGYQRSEVPKSVHYDFFMNLVHPEDQEMTMQKMRDAMTGVNTTYETTYRIKALNDEWHWFYDIGKIVQFDENGKALMAAGIVFDVTSQKIEEESLRRESSRLQEEASTDVLTGVMNRRAILNELSYRSNPNLSQTKSLSIAMFDIDHFKSINDRFGHPVGDLVLAKVAEIIGTTIRGFDTVGRYGGEEFLVIFPNTELSKAEKAAQRIRENIEKHHFESVGKVTVSGGVVERRGENQSDLIKRADELLYQSKHNGRNRISIG